MTTRPRPSPVRSITSFPLISLITLIGGGGEVAAQTLPPPPLEAPAVDPPAPALPDDAPAPDGTAPAAATPPAPAPAPIDPGRLDEIEQLARIAARKHELIDERAPDWDAAAKRLKETPVTQADDKGFGLRSEDGGTSLRVRALVQADYRGFVDDDALQANDTFLIRRFRPSLEGTLFGLVDYRLLPELAGTVQLLDAYGDVHPWTWLHVRLGRFKGPLGLERLQSDADLPLLERALDSNLSSVRDLGAQVWGDIGGGRAQYAIAILNGAVDGTNPDNDTNHAKDLAARVFFQPLRGEGLQGLGDLGVGFAAAFGNRKGRLPAGTTAAVTGLPAFRTSGQVTFFQYLAPTDTTGATTAFANRLTVHLNSQLYYYYDSFGLLAEYLQVRQGIQRGNTTTTLTHHAAHATLSFAINGRVGYDGVTPLRAFDRKTGSVGAIEIAVRLAWLRADAATFGNPGGGGSGGTQYADPLRSARTAQSWAAGLTWVPRRNFHFAINFEQTSFTGGAGTTAAPANRKLENVAITRLQVNF